MSSETIEAAKAKAREYFAARGTQAPAGALRERIAEAFEALETFLDTVPPAAAARTAIAGEWTIHEIVDHLVETHRPGLDELWCLLAGRRPPGEAIPAGLQSKAPLTRPWPWLRGELARIHGEILRTLDAVPPDFTTDARAPIVMVVNVADERGKLVPVHWIEDLDWKAYSITWRLHVIDHLKQARRVLAALP
jgi:DinB superfamily